MGGLVAHSEVMTTKNTDSCWAFYFSLRAYFFYTSYFFTLFVFTKFERRPGKAVLEKKKMRSRFSSGVGEKQDLFSQSSLKILGCGASCVEMFHSNLLPEHSKGAFFLTAQQSSWTSSLSFFFSFQRPELQT